MLTETKARNVKPNDKSLADGTVSGLWLIPGKSKGIGKWNLRFVSPVSGKRRDMGLGTFPDIKIEQARRLGIAAREAIAVGKDPIDERKRLQAAEENERDAQTFQTAAQKVFEERKVGWKSGGKHIAQWINTMTSYVFPVIGTRPVVGLKAADFADVLRPIWHTKAETASRVKQRCHEVMKWCWAHELIAANPVDMVSSILGPQPSKRDRVVHHPAMPWREIPEFINDTLRPKSDVTRLALEFIILTAARTGEVRGMTWAEVDFEKRVWTVPAARMKRKKEHRVPLSVRALEILEVQKAAEIDPELVFPSPRGKTLSDMAFTRFLRNHAAESAYSERKAVAHGFRSSFRDWASENGYRRELAEKALSHGIRDQTEAAYNRTELVEERRSMMEAWSLWVTRAKESEPH